MCQLHSLYLPHSALNIPSKAFLVWMLVWCFLTWIIWSLKESRWNMEYGKQGNLLFVCSLWDKTCVSVSLKSWRRRKCLSGKCLWGREEEKRALGGAALSSWYISTPAPTVCFSEYVQAHQALKRGGKVREHPGGSQLLPASTAGKGIRIKRKTNAIPPLIIGFNWVFKDLYGVFVLFMKWLIFSTGCYCSTVGKCLCKGIKLTNSQSK